MEPKQNTEILQSNASNHLRRLQAAIPDTIDGILLSCPMHQYYISGFPFEDGYVALTREQAWLFTDFRYIEAAEKAVLGTLSVVQSISLGQIAQTLRSAGVETLGYEDRFVTVANSAALKKAFAPMCLQGIGGLIEDLRRTKDACEIALIKKAQRLTDEAFSHILGYLTPEITERDVALELEFYMRKNGADGLSFPVIALGGEATAKPHGVPENRPLGRGFVTMDFGCTVGGYCSDMTRTVCIGEPDEEMKRVYETVKTAQAMVLDTIALHESCKVLDGVARNHITAAGYGKCFGHSLGHGVGLYIHERPNLSPMAPDHLLLENGDVVTVEPGIYLAGKFGVRIEDMVILHDGIAEDITHSDRSLTIL